MATESGDWVQPIINDEQLVRSRGGPDAEIISDSVVDHILEHSRKPGIAVLIPAYNEGLTIGSVVLQARKHADLVLVINDGSRDKTSEVAQAAGAEVIDHMENGGKAAALKTGFDELLKKDCEIIVMMDGDGQHSVDDIDDLIAPILNDQADLVIGSRFLKKDNSIPLYRQVGQRILNRITNASSSVKVTDTQSGFRALNRRALQSMDFHSQGYAVEQDMIVHCSDQGLRIKEVPISVRYDVPNGHKQGSMKMGLNLLKQVVATIGYKRPLLLFGIPGTILCLIGVIIGIFTLFEVYFIGSWLMQSLLAGFMVMVGSNLAISALTLNSLSTLVRMSRSR